jgi:hypothetical protein
MRAENAQPAADVLVNAIEGEPGLKIVRSLEFHAETLSSE